MVPKMPRIRSHLRLTPNKEYPFHHSQPPVSTKEMTERKKTSS